MAMYFRTAECPTRSEAQKSKFGENRVQIAKRCVLVEKTCFVFVNIKVLRLRSATA